MKSARMNPWLRWLCAVPALLLCPAVVWGQTVIIVVPPPHPTPVVLPRPVPPPSEYKVKSVDVQAGIKDQSARVQISQVFQNTGSTTLEAQLIFPMPDNAAISGLTLLVDGKELTGKLMKKDEARRVYEDIVRRRKDPALLEFMGQGMYQTSVFPVPAGAERKVEIRYNQLLKKDNGLIDLLLPIGTNRHSTKPIETLDVVVRVEATEPIKTVYSPTHQLQVERPDDKHAVAKLSLKNVTKPDDFRLFYSTTAGLVGMNVISYKPQDSDEGYFVLLASPDVKQEHAEKIDRTLLFVFDRSGSMSGQKIEQAKQALKFLINQMKPEDTFNIIVYDSAVETFRPELQRADADTVKAALGFVDNLYAGGSTNINDALQTALKQVTDSKRPTYVLFMTDGLPTVGELDEQKIANNAKQTNTNQARLFAFGVGFDVNSRLLDRLSSGNRGQSVFVRPNENIEAHVSALYNKIGSPLLTDLAVNIEFDNKQTTNISRTYPRQLTDLFQGEQLVYVGRYKQGGTAKITLTGNVGKEKKSFDFPATFVEKSTDETNGFVEKLWAMRRIGEIIDELDLKGQNQELINELVQLSLKHGILTPYTSFLADEDVSLANRDRNVERAGEVASRELGKAEGQGGFAQRQFKGQLQSAAQAPSAGLNRADALAESAPTAAAPSGRSGNGTRPGFLAGPTTDKKPAADNVRNIGQKTFFRKNQQWQDASVTPEQEKQAIHIVQFSDEYFELAARHGGTLAKYIAFDEPVIVNLDGKTYQIAPPKP